MSQGALSEAEVLAWYDGKSFTSDWTTWHYQVWDEILRPFRERDVAVLELGSWEGRSALFFLNYLRKARVTCVDTFGGSDEHQLDAHFAALVPETERRFDGNTAAFKSRLEKIKGMSSKVLPELGIDARRFDIIYVDASHRAADVYSDGVLAWPLLRKDGVMIFDDYEWRGFDSDRENPKLGIDTFLRDFDGQYRLLHRGYQIAVAKP